MSDWTCKLVDISEAQQGRDFIRLLDEYAMDPMGGGRALSDEVKQRLLQDIPGNPAFRVMLAYEASRAIGLANALLGYSTFAARPLMNIHDIVVTAEYRGRGVSRCLFAALEQEARAAGCCKLTLEVLEGNHIAQRAYRDAGFEPYELAPELGHALFWHKVL